MDRDDATDGVAKEPVPAHQPSARPTVSEGLAGASPKTAQSESRGRTVWDFTSEELGRIRGSAPTNWYRVVFFLLVVSAVAFGFSWLNDSLRSVAVAAQGMAGHVAEIKAEAAKSAAAAAEIRAAVVGSPNYSAWFSRHVATSVACKARGLEAIQIAGGRDINATQTSSVWENFSTGEHSPRFIASVHCPEDFIVYVLAIGPDAKVAESYKDKIKSAFLAAVAK
jgi:hypothetical protein